MDSFIIALWVLNLVFACVFLHSAYSVYSNWNNGDVSMKGYIALMGGHGFILELYRFILVRVDVVIYESINIFNLHNLAVVALVIAMIAFICALKIGLKKDELDESEKGSKILIIYVMVGSLGFITGLKVKLDVLITNFIL